MSALSDQIEKWLKERIDEANGTLRFTRHGLAEEMNCAPSQITYVLATRFRSSQGYIVESRRGGGGSIYIRRADFSDRTLFLMHTVNSIGDQVTSAQAQVILNNLLESEVISQEAYGMLRAAISHRALSSAPVEEKDALRASILNAMLLSLTAE